MNVIPLANATPETEVVLRLKEPRDVLHHEDQRLHFLYGTAEVLPQPVEWIIRISPAHEAETLAWRPADEDVRFGERINLQNVSTLHMGGSEVYLVRKSCPRITVDREDGDKRRPGINEPSAHAPRATEHIR
jgi:hypothetical protein